MNMLIIKFNDIVNNPKILLKSSKFLEIPIENIVYKKAIQVLKILQFLRLVLKINYGLILFVNQGLN